MTRFDKFNNERNGIPDPDPAEPIPTVEAPTTNGTKGHRHSSEGSDDRTPKKHSYDDSDGEPSQPKKKQKKSKKVVDADAAYAAKLQAELNAASRSSRSTRGGNTKKRAPLPKKKKEKKKSSNKVRDEDDSDLGSGSGGEKKEVKRTGGFHVCIERIWDAWRLTVFTEANDTVTGTIRALGRNQRKSHVSLSHASNPAPRQ